MIFTTYPIPIKVYNNMYTDRWLPHSHYFSRYTSIQAYSHPSLGGIYRSTIDLAKCTMQKPVGVALHDLDLVLAQCQSWLPDVATTIPDLEPELMVAVCCMHKWPSLPACCWQGLVVDTGDKHCIFPAAWYGHLGLCYKPYVEVWCP